MINHVSHMVLARVQNYKDSAVFYRFSVDSNQLESIGAEEVIKTTKQVSRALVSLGYGHDSKIGIFGNNRPEWTFADIGILNIRGVVVPFYATSNKEQLKYIVDETEMELMFVDDEVQLEKAISLLNKTTLKTIVSFSKVKNEHESVMGWHDFCKLGDKDDENKVEELLKAASQEDIASIIYTSGTTGEPKGAMLSHQNFMSSFKINDERLDITENDSSLAFLPLSHIFERCWTFFLIYTGASNTFLSNPRKVIDVLPIINPTVMCVVPRFFEKTYDGIYEEYLRWSSTKQKIFDWSVAVAHKTIGPKKVSFPLSLEHKIAKKLVLNKLRSIFGHQLRMTPCAGAAIRPELLKFFHAIGLFVNYGYGATETTATVSCMRTDKYDLDTCGSIMPETDVRIGDNEEIIITADTIFKGYYKKPEETAKVLEGKTFKSGDQGFISDDGYFVMTDRIKDMMKTSGGKYISPQKLELLIGTNKFVEQIVVIGDNRKFVSALIIPAYETLKSKEKELDIVGKDGKEISESKRVYEFYEKLINDEQKGLDGYEQIKNFIIMPEAFSIENNALTNTLKIKRKLVTELNRELIDSMYE
jgi:long-chain acyl-CoA synthetase